MLDTSLAQAQHLGAALARLEHLFGFKPQRAAQEWEPGWTEGPDPDEPQPGCVRGLDEDREPYCATHWADWPCPRAVADPSDDGEESCEDCGDSGLLEFEREYEDRLVGWDYVTCHCGRPS